MIFEKRFKMVFESLLPIFGGTGAFVLTIGGCLWKVFRSYHVQCVKGESFENAPITTLPNTWEHSYNETLAHCFKRMVFAKQDKANKWHIHMQKGEGSVYVYTDMYNASANKQRFLRLRLTGVPANAKISFVHKYWSGTSREYIESEFHPPKYTPIKPVNGVHKYLEPSLIGVDDVTKEQLGIHFSARDVAYKDCVVEEAYMKEPTNICNLICCGRHGFTLLYRRKENN